MLDLILESCVLASFHDVTSTMKADAQLGWLLELPGSLVHGSIIPCQARTRMPAVVTSTWAQGFRLASISFGKDIVLHYLFCISLFTESISEALRNISSCSQYPWLPGMSISARGGSSLRLQRW